MIPQIKLPNLVGIRPERPKYHRFTLLDDTFTRKKLLHSHPATEDRPRINHYEDNSFTVGEQPIVYIRKGDEWEPLFQFKGILVEYIDIHEDGDKGEDDE